MLLQLFCILWIACTEWPEWIFKARDISEVERAIWLLWQQQQWAAHPMWERTVWDTCIKITERSLHIDLPACLKKSLGKGMERKALRVTYKKNFQRVKYGKLLWVTANRGSSTFTLMTPSLCDTSFLITRCFQVLRGEVCSRGFYLK